MPEIPETIDRSILAPFRDQLGWKIGACSVRPYNRTETQVYGTNYLHHLYSETANSGRHVLSSSFCGMPDLSADAVCAYLHSRSPLLLMCMDTADDPNVFDVVGYSYPTVWCGTKETERSILFGYSIFKRVWGTPEASVLGMLTTAYYFLTFDLVAMHGQRYPWNHLTGKYTGQFGTRDVGVLPRFLLHKGKLVDCVLSSLLREDFEKYAQEQLTTILPLVTP
jgi:hypothetical protein